MAQINDILPPFVISAGMLLRLNPIPESWGHLVFVIAVKVFMGSVLYVVTRSLKMESADYVLAFVKKIIKKTQGINPGRHVV